MADTWTPISGYTTQDYTDTAIFEVDPDTKKIALITGQALVAGEENSQYIKFVLDRYWDGIDIKDKAFYVEYALAGTYYGKTAAVNAEYNTEQVRFGWIVPKEACCISGTLLFVLRIESTDYVLKTQIAEHPVFKSVNVEDVVPEPTKEAWYREFEARVETAIDDAETALTAAQVAQTAAENAALNAQTSEENAETAAAMAQTRYGSPLVAQTADEMVEQNRVYVYVGSESGYSNGHWYYYNGTEWADGGAYNGSAVNTDTTLTQSGMAADAKKTGDEIEQIKEDLSAIITTASKLSSYTYYPFGAYTTGLRLKPTTGETYSGGANNFVFDDFIAIPKGRIYFESKAGYVCNIVFYDVNKNVVDTMADDIHMVSLPGKYYDNSTADYMRVGVYCSSGASGSEHCYAYTFNEKANELMPLWLNTDVNQASQRNNRMTCDYMYADEPVMVVNNDPTKLIFGVVLYDENKIQLKTYYVADVKTVNYVNIPKGHYFRIYTDPPTSQQISPTEGYVGVIEVKKAKVGFLNLVFNDEWFGLTASMVGLIDMAYAEKDTLASCADYGTTYNYKVALYASDGDVKPALVQDSIYKDFIIPKGSYYRIAVKRVSGTVTLSDYDAAITVTELPTNTENTKGVVSAVGKTRMQFDSDSVPSYYTSHMASKIDTINGLKSENTIQFAFITDYHFGTYQNANNARCLLTEIVKNTPVNMVFNGGDAWTRGTGSSSYGQAKKRLLNGINETTPNAPCNWFFAIGNHDTGLDYSTSGGVTTTYGPEFTTPELQQIMGGNITGYNMVFDPASNLLAYWFDVDNFRFIVSNVGLGTVGSDEAHANVKLFFAEALATMENRTGIVVSHAYYSSSGGSNSQTAELAAMIVAYNARSTYAINSVGNVDFANCAGEVAMWISGHTHKDLSETLSDGTPIICTTTANAGGELGGLDRTIGTVNENAFDIITVDTVNKTVNATRIGAGQDRTLSYGGE